MASPAPSMDVPAAIAIVVLGRIQVLTGPLVPNAICWIVASIKRFNPPFGLVVIACVAAIHPCVHIATLVAISVLSSVQVLIVEVTVSDLHSSIAPLRHGKLESEES